MQILSVILLLHALCASTQPWPGAASNKGSIEPLSTRAGPNPKMFQDIVTWDKYSFMINGERIMVFSGEFHPWRLPSPSLWLDVLHKVKALGFNTISIYINWSLIEGTKGIINMNGIFSYDELFNAAREAGLYVIVRPGPYINAELSAGGLPGWRFHAPEGIYWRTDNPSYFDEIKHYINAVAKVIAKHQITNDGPIILVQLENELSDNAPVPGTVFPPLDYMAFLELSMRNASVHVPTFHNDVGHRGVWSNTSYPDIYAYDNYPLSCGSLSSALPQDDWDLYLKFSSYDPHFVAEFTDGFYDMNGGIGYSNISACPAQFEPGISRIYYTNLYAMSVNALSLYMIYGGTNWGHMHWDKIYTSYDFRAAIAEDRSIAREKYAEIKLEAQFLKVTPALRTSRLVAKASPERTSNNAIVCTETRDDMSNMTLWTTRHGEVTNMDNVTYTLSIPTSRGNKIIPELGGKLSITGYDSKMHVSDYQFGKHTVLYSSADILSWQKIGNTHVLLVYGRAGETHETSFIVERNQTSGCSVLEGSINDCNVEDDVITVNYNIVGQSIVRIGADILLYVLSHQEASKFWFPELPTGKLIPSISNDTIMVKGPYLVRTATIKGNTLWLTGDLNETVSIEIIAPQGINNFRWHGEAIRSHTTRQGTITSSLLYKEPKISLPNLAKLHWRSHDSLPERSGNYDDSRWVRATNTTSVNGARKLTTPTDLYAGTYGYHAGNFIYRGSFTAKGDESSMYLQVHGGMSSAFSVWLNGEFIGSSAGTTATTPVSKTFQFPRTLGAGSKNLVTILAENRGYNENESGGVTYPRGILDYQVGDSHTNTSWKIAGNLGGEDYADKTRGPLNEGGFFAERMGWHQPEPPSANWITKSPLAGVSQPGVEIYSSSFNLNLDDGYDVPIYVEMKGTSEVRVHLYVNGYKFGQYIENIGPQSQFPIPQGVLNHKGKNSIALIVWSLNPSGGKLVELALGISSVVQWGYKDVKSVAQPYFKKRTNAY